MNHDEYLPESPITTFEVATTLIAAIFQLAPAVYMFKKDPASKHFSEYAVMTKIAAALDTFDATGFPFTERLWDRVVYDTPEKGMYIVEGYGSVGEGSFSEWIEEFIVGVGDADVDGLPFLHEDVILAKVIAEYLCNPNRRYETRMFAERD